MFALAILIGTFAYGVYILGLLQMLYIPHVLALLLLIGIGGAVWIYHDRYIPRFLSTTQPVLKRKYSWYLVLLALLVSIYFLGALSPELAFDALWYHLTIPKIYIQQHGITHIPGGLLYYSSMPKLTEMLYTAALMLHDEILAKFLHFGFGVLTAVAIFIFSKKFLPTTFSLLASLIFYSNLVVAWESTTAYVDLARTFFEFMAVWGIYNYIDQKNKLWLTESAVMLGLAICTKLLAAPSLILCVLLIWMYHPGDVREKVFDILKYILMTVFIVSPWLITAFINTGNPVFPIFSGYPLSLEYLHPITILYDVFTVFVRADDPINPIYIIALPLLIGVWKRIPYTQKLLAVYVCTSLVIWIITPRTGGGRFILPYLPVLSVVTALVFQKVKDRKLSHVGIVLVCLIACITIGYRFVAQLKTVPYLLGYESKDSYLTKHLNFEFGDFYDVDGYFDRTIKHNDRVLVYGIHNVYYVNFPFVHETYVKKGDEFNYILTTDEIDLPDRFRYWKEVYKNPKTHVILYNFNTSKWVY